ncbi:MAG: energy transducer TonB [Paludibacterium sp.]|uniref:energy transducer TonB n=1 Tax=Paludibacterium sp. TaxID=1917523 RepID=UPI0025FF6762|nr:energy transducer TonB [Paludibacterium sp.]MBV8049453.1 energy transducer TonB [Paludibacterium sp.]MBV8645993.1 energy transducer TonB [Paludibacterium sp.]
MRRHSPLGVAIGLSLFAHALLLGLWAARPPRPAAPLQVVLQAAPDAGLGAVGPQARTPRAGAAHPAVPAARTAEHAPVAAPGPQPATASPAAAPAPSVTVSAAPPAPAAGSAAASPDGGSGTGDGHGGGTVTPARYLGGTPPYPEQARERGETGRVGVLVTIAADGQVREVALLRSSGFNDLDQAALDYLRHGRFTPARRAGVAVDSQLKMAMPFHLDY